MRRMGWSFCFLLLFLSPVFGQEEDGDRLRVLSFNVRAGLIPDFENGWEHRRDICLDFLERVDADVVGLQEAVRNQIDDMLGRLSHHRLAEPSGREGYDFRFSVLLYDRRRLRLLDCKEVWLSETPTVAASKSGAWGNVFPRLYVRARFEDRRTGTRFLVFNTHWSNMSAEARRRSARMMRSALNDVPKETPVLLLGDLNTGVRSRAFRHLTEGGEPELLDTFDLARKREGPKGTIHGFGRFVGGRIDHVLVTKKCRIRLHRVCDDARDGRYPSDHFPVLVDLYFPTRRWF